MCYKERVQVEPTELCGDSQEAAHVEIEDQRVTLFVCSDKKE